MLRPMRIPPGIVRPGTKYDAKGAWYDCNLVRWRDGVLQPMGGWTLLSGAGDAQIDGVTRKIYPWVLNSGDVQVAIGTNTKLYYYSAGTLTDITPAGFTTGPVDASGTYWSRTEAATWSVDSYGEDLVAVHTSDGRLLYYDDSAGTTAALSNAPTSNLGVVVTPENFIVALGAGGDARLVKWCDQDDNTAWTADTTNQAGEQPLPTKGKILAGRASRSETLIWTTADLWAMRYIAGNFIYSLEKVGDGGAISRNSMAMVDGVAVYMGEENFYRYDGFVQPIPCSVSDYVFSDLNREQASKISADVRSDYHEVWWYYPSSGSTENDRYVVYNYLQNIWYLGSIRRTCGTDRKFLEFPMAAGPSGEVYFHEDGDTYADEDATTHTPFVESGPFEIGEAGDRVMMVRQIVPDEATLGDADLYVYHSFYPTDTETSTGPLTVGQPTDVRITARQVRLRIQHDQADWRFGTPRFDIVPCGRR